MKEYFYTITESMLDLGLRGTELNLFAVIYGYSQRGDGCCYANRAELARRCGVSSTRTIDAALDTLLEKGLIKRSNIQKDGQWLIAYSYTGCADFAHGCANSAHPTAQKLQGGCANSAHKENKEENTSISIIPPTPQEVADYVRSRGWTDPEGFAAHYLAYHTVSGWKMSNGKKIQNWKLNVVSWEPNNKTRTFSTPKAPASPAAGPMRQMTDEEYRASLRQ